MRLLLLLARTTTTQLLLHRRRDTSVHTQRAESIEEVITRLPRPTAREAITVSALKHAHEVIHTAHSGTRRRRRRRHTLRRPRESFEAGRIAHGRLMQARGRSAVKVDIEEILGVVLGRASGAAYGGCGGGCGDGVLGGVAGGFVDCFLLQGAGAVMA